MRTARLSFNPAFPLAPVRKRLFGGFVEHMGRCVYGGIYDPAHPSADADGFRADVLALVRELGVTLVRYPGGNFVSGYRWEDGIGPRTSRPARLDPAWHSVETNEIGLDEFIRWARRAGVEPMLTLNLGTRGVQDALDLLEYANHRRGTRLSDLRAAHGAPEPHGVRMWCLGNEMDGSWQIGHKTAEEYGRLAAETARAMRMIDPGLELVACGSSHGRMPTFGQWESTVLDLAFEQIDHIAAHAYFAPAGDLGSFLASATDMDRMISSVVATADAVAARRRGRRQITVAVDEWNVWHRPSEPPEEWTRAPRISEDTFTVADAVVVGDLLITLLNHADRVAVACQAQLVNVLAPIRTEPDRPAWRQTIFHPFALTARLARGTVLRTELDVPEYDTARYGRVPLLAAAATHRGDGEVVVFVVNRHQQEPIELTVDASAVPGHAIAEHLAVTDPDPTAANTWQAPERVRPHTRPVPRGRAVELSPISWNVLRLRQS
ncbi:alpha-N-arabinofuranosidase [Pseudonocardia hispaniensis]|uniref:non-reducing end alpha-L-arabinofuranosidase n=1 Tax=Pseudonocardia hispaniensis TaxID=904933 RepID=A0ABW1J536_9PSEU